MSADHVADAIETIRVAHENVLETAKQASQDALDAMVDALAPHAALTRGELADLIAPKIDSVAVRTVRAVTDISRGMSEFLDSARASMEAANLPDTLPDDWVA